MKKIFVEPHKLLEVAKKIDDKNESFNKLQSQLYEEVDIMRNSWSGKDNMAFTNKIKDYHNFMRTVSLVMSQYTDFLKNTANSYSRIQDEIYNEANRIAG